MHDRQYLLKLKNIGWSDQRIAEKLGWPVARVQSELLRGMEELRQNLENGYAGLVDKFTIQCHQYQLLGESMKDIANALSTMLTHEELEALWDKDPKVMARKVKAACIPLRPFAESPRSVPESN